MPTEWTPERRAQQAEAMKKIHAAKREKAAPAPDINPPANDGLVLPPPPLPRHARAAPADVVSTDAPTFDISLLIADLESLPIDQISYASCGSLLNALSAASTAIALRRRQAQEQLDAGTHRAPCATCGRLIDISKPGGFQILTERDEHFQPRNVYYCSQNCLLAKNMPSHRVKRIAGDVGAKA
jgi:hypothetical protein